jgi:hypothetical protein
VFQPRGLILKYGIAGEEPVAEDSFPAQVVYLSPSPPPPDVAVQGNSPLLPTL